MQKKQKSPLLELLLNIILPTLILNKGAAYLGNDGSTKSLVLAMLFPVLYAIYDYTQSRKINFISILGFLSILMTGGFGLMKVEGHWFAIKEAAFPFVIGAVVLVSAYTSRPLIQMMVYNDSLLQVSKVEAALQEKGTTKEFSKHLRLSTVYFSFSFFFSAILNYVLAVRIFTEIPLNLPEEQRSQILNQQIADMTWQGYVVILIPSMLIMGVILWHLFNGVKKYTGYGFNEILKEVK